MLSPHLQVEGHRAGEWADVRMLLAPGAWVERRLPRGQVEELSIELQRWLLDTSVLDLGST